MRSNNKKVLGAAAVAGVVALTGSAFTAGGLSSTAGDEFVGGSVDQTVNGASITDISYNVDEAANKITSVALTFAAGATGKVPTITFTGGTANGTYTCTAVAVTTGASSCTAASGSEASNNTTSLDIQVV